MENTRILRDNVLLEFFPVVTTTKAGLHLPRLEDSKPFQAKVLAVGPEVRHKDLFLTEGQTVLASFVGETVDDRNENIRIVPLNSILAISKDCLVKRKKRS